jgi:hypothetical protein
MFFYGYSWFVPLVKVSAGRKAIDAGLRLDDDLAVRGQLASKAQAVFQDPGFRIDNAQKRPVISRSGKDLLDPVARHAVVEPLLDSLVELAALGADLSFSRPVHLVDDAVLKDFVVPSYSFGHTDSP